MNSYVHVSSCIHSFIHATNVYGVYPTYHEPSARLGIEVANETTRSVLAFRVYDIVGDRTPSHCQQGKQQLLQWAYVLST